MIRSKFAAAIIATGAIVALAAPSAYAASHVTYKVTAGKKKAGSATFAAKTARGTTAKPAITFTDDRSNTAVGCTSGKASGTVKLGAKVKAARLGTISKTSYANCTALGGAITLTQTQVGTWHLRGSGKTVNGVTKVYINRVKTLVKSPACSFTLAGSADGTYTNAKHRLVLQPRANSGHALVVSKVVGCAGVIANKDTVSFVGTFKVSTSKGRLKIS